MRRLWAAAQVAVVALIGTTAAIIGRTDAFSPPLQTSRRRHQHHRHNLQQDVARALYAATIEKSDTQVLVDPQNATLPRNVTDVIQDLSDAERAVKMEELIANDLIKQIELEAAAAVDEMLDEECEVDYEKGGPKDELCVDEEKKTGFRNALRGVIGKTLQLVRGSTAAAEIEAKFESEDGKISEGEVLERGWEKRANSAAILRNAEVWRFALKSVFRVLKPRKMKTTGASDDEIKVAQTEAAEYIRDGLLRLGPSFVKLGQVVSTRTDVLPTTYTDVLKSLTDDVPGFSGTKAKQIVSQELGKPCDAVFQDFSAEPLKAASLGQVHTATYKGQKVAIKVQRAGLKELFDVDLKNLKKLAVLLDKFDPKSDGADRNWVNIYEESERLLYLEIDYINEADNTERFAKDFKDYTWVRTPKVYRAVTTPRILTMEYVEAFKLTDTKEVDRQGLDRQLLSERVANSFLRQIVETGYFHADPHREI